MLDERDTLIKGLSHTVARMDDSMKIMNDKLERLEFSEEITTEQSKDINNACRKRIYEILGNDPNVRARYYRIFAQRLWSDMRRHYGLGSSIAKTSKRNYQRVLDGIEMWYPACGVQALKEWKDANAKARAEAKEKGYL